MSFIWQKVSVTIIFGLASVIIAFDVVRAIMTSIASAHAIRPFLFETLELSIAVIISTLPSYRVLLPASRRTPNQSYESNMLANLSKRASPTSISPLSPANTSPLMVSDDNKRTETWNANDNRSWERQIHVHDLCPTPPEEARIVVKPREALGFNHDLEK
ncbi:MAG: hypothetical protein M1837_007292 [Sclerophora amabilis]|nr:MAG: hypothetical protein M1837_007292 [Sclerophora amabilis]